MAIFNSYVTNYQRVPVLEKKNMSSIPCFDLSHIPHNPYPRFLGKTRLGNQFWSSSWELLGHYPDRGTGWGPAVMFVGL